MAALAGLALFTVQARSQADGDTLCEKPATLPCLPIKPARPLGPLVPPPKQAPVTAFVDDLSTKDARLDVVIGQSRILTLKQDLKGRPTVAVGDPTVVDFTILSSRQFRLSGRNIGATDLSIVTDGEAYSFEVRVVADLEPLRLQLRAIFPSARVELTQVRDNIVIEGQARDTIQIQQIVETVRAYIDSVYNAIQQKTFSASTAPAAFPGGNPVERTPAPRLPGQAPGQAAPPGTFGAPPTPPTPAGPETGLFATTFIAAKPHLINLLRIPGSQQVLLKVRVAELNRTSMRQIGADFLSIDHDTGAIVGTQIGGTNVTATGQIANVGALLGQSTASGAASATQTAARRLTGTATNLVSGTTTLFGIFEKGDFDVMLSALRRNSLLKILAEPNLVAMNGQQASFLAGGEFPVPVPQSSSGGAAPTVTVEFKEFGVRLGFVPYIEDDEVIRLSVDPEVSQIDFSIGTVLVPGGTPVPGTSTRKAHTTVELHQGQTLAIAGLMQLTLDGNTARIPGLGDLPIIGPFFSNTTSERVEKELVVLVTPYLAEPMNANQVPPTPGDEVNAPNDLEFYFMNRIEGRTGKDFRATTGYDDALHILRCFWRLDRDHVCGPHGFGD
jgi:pilus assembly protein CpaC